MTDRSKRCRNSCILASTTTAHSTFLCLTVSFGFFFTLQIFSGELQECTVAANPQCPAILSSPPPGSRLGQIIIFLHSLEAGSRSAFTPGCPIICHVRATISSWSPVQGSNRCCYPGIPPRIRQIHPTAELDVPSICPAQTNTPCGDLLVPSRGNQIIELFWSFVSVIWNNGLKTGSPLPAVLSVMDGSGDRSRVRFCRSLSHYTALDYAHW